MFAPIVKPLGLSLLTVDQVGILIILALTVNHAGIKTLKDVSVMGVQTS